MIISRRQLERLANAAHADGVSWHDFWRQHGPHVVALEPWDRAAYHRLVRRLSHLLTCGDLDGQPIANSWPRPEPWEIPSV